MTDDDWPAIRSHLTDRVRTAIDRSAYGDWRSIAGRDAISLAFGFPFPESFPQDELIAAAETVFEEEGSQALQYGGGEYADCLRDVVVSRERDRGIDATTDSVLLTNGATHAIDGVCRAFFDPGDVLIVESPTFMGALGVFRNYGVDVVGVPVDDDGLDVDALAETLATRRDAGHTSPTMLYTIPSFQNPTGTTLPRGRRQRLLSLADDYDFAILEDDAYGALRYDGESPPPLAALDDAGRVVRVGTFSKTVAPGVRLGWLHANERIRDAVDTVTPGGTNTFTRSVVGCYCERRDDDAISELRSAYRERRDRMLDALSASMPEGTDWTVPDGGFFVWVELPEGVDANATLEPAAQEGVTFLPGSMFFPEDGGEHCLRLSFSYETPAAIERGVHRLARTVKRRQ